MRRKILNQKDYVDLVNEMIEHDRHYYGKCKPVISDYEYDLLIKDLQEWEKLYPHMAMPESPTQRIGEVLQKGFEHKSHETPMLSLANTYSKKEVEDFINRVYKLVEKKDLAFCTELKIDGTAISVRYEKGKFVRALTRGNGKTGDDVSANMKTIKTLPLKLSGNFPDSIEIRGEVFIHKSIFNKLNKQRQEEGLDIFANPRNAAAGSLKLLDSFEASKRKLDVIFYGIANEERYISSQAKMHTYLKKLSLPVAKESHFKKCKNIEEIFSFAAFIENDRKKISFDIDGIVIKVDDIFLHKELGFTGKSPRYAVAYKFAAEKAETIIRDITVQVGRTGVLTPVAELEPVHLAGSTISRATLHNQDEILRKDIRIGDTVVIEKGGDVIPKVVSVDYSKRKKDSVAFKLPKKCPVCHENIVSFEDEVAYRCVNPYCLGQILRRLIYFASKEALDIENLGIKVMKALFEKGYVKNFSDIYFLNEKKLSNLEGFKEKSIENLLTSIEKSKKCPMNKFIMALGIKYVGKETADILAGSVKNMDDLKKLSKEELLALEGIGEKVADSIIDFFKDKNNLKEIDLLLSVGVKPQKVNKGIFQNHMFLKKIFVLTGTLDKYSRNEAIDLIKQRGGKVSSSVSKKTNFVLVGKDPGSKLAKAKELNVKILSESEFEKML